jgi:Uma2 family endonuclease
MSIEIARPPRPEIVYPDSDGEPMADNTLQWQWVVTMTGGVDAVFRDDPNVFVAGDLLWYPVEGDPTIRMAPDTMVVFGRPKGYRGSYQQWREGGIAPQVVFEILSPGNRVGKMVRKFQFHDRYGVEEYYIHDPETFELTGWLRSGQGLQEIPEMAGWVSPRLGIRFEPVTGGDLKIHGPDGRPFATFVELAQQRDELAHERDELAHERDELAHERDAERQRAERLAAQLRALGLEPES